MCELQATVEIQVELSKFYNVDLFQRGYYQIRTSLKTPPKSPCKVEVSLPRNSECSLVFPASIINGVAVSKTFQILYRNEDVAVNDVVLFKVHMLVDAQRIEETIDSSDFQLAVDLWFTDEEFGPDQQEKLQCVSQRTLKLHFTAAKGLHHHVPVLFDYFHLSVMCITIHASLVALHQPYISVPNKQPKSGWLTRGPEHATLESVLFGNKPSIANAKCAISQRLQAGCSMHRSICNVLLSAYESLQTSFETLEGKLPEAQRLNIEHTDCHTRLETLTEIAQSFQNEEDLLQTATSDVAQLCAENVILWSQYLEMVSLSEKVTYHLAKEHHLQRVKRFAEAFFTYEFHKQATVACFEPSIHGHTDLAAIVRGSQYFQSIPGLPVECMELDGDHTTLPIVFEDLYMEESAVNMRTRRQSLDVETSSLKDSSVDGKESSPERASSVKSRSDTSSTHSDGSPKAIRRGKKLKFIKNIKPEAFKRPSSYSCADAEAKETINKQDCMLIGYRKVHQSTSAPIVELGTLSPAPTSTYIPEEEENSDDLQALHNSVSLPSLLIRNQMLTVPRSSLPNLHDHQISQGTERKGSIASAELDNNSSPGSERAKDSQMADTLSATMQFSSQENVENGYVAQSNLPLDCLNSLEGSTEEQAEGSTKEKPDENTNYSSSSVDFEALADTLTEALGEPEEKKSDTVDMGNLTDLSSLPKLPGVTSGSTSGIGSTVQSSSGTVDRSDTGSTSELQSSQTLRTECSQMDEACESSGTGNTAADTKDTKYTVMEFLREEYENDLKATASVENAQNGPTQNGEIGSSCSLTNIPNGEDIPYNSRLRGDTNLHSRLGGPLSGSQPITSQPLALGAIATSASVPELSSLHLQSDQRLVSVVGNKTINFITAKEELKRQLKYQGHLYSDFPSQASTIPYFWPPSDYNSDEGIHLVVCVHGLDGNSADLRLVRTYLEMALPGSRIDFLMSERNQHDTFADFEVMTDRLVAEILYHIEMYSINPSRVSFVGHSLGNLIIRSALSRPEMVPLLPRLYTFLSLSGPHLGTLYNSSGLVNMGMWFMQKWKKSGSLLQLSLKDHPDPRQSFLYKLSQKPGMEFFRNILLVGSIQDRYVPFHSTRIELCRPALKDTSSLGAVYMEMVDNILQPILYKSDVSLVRYDVFHALPNTANSLIGRAAHIAVLDSELFIEKFTTVTALKYFK